MIAQVAYTVPVSAMVDTETGEVLRVVVLDEEIKRDEPLDVVDHAGNPIDGAAVCQRAAEIADDPYAVWPAWEFGY